MMRMRGLLKMIVGRNMLCSSRRMKLHSYSWYYNHNTNNIFSRNFHISTTRATFNSTMYSKQDSPCFLYPDNTRRKYHGAEEKTKEELQKISKGDIINLQQLLFTQDRDYLVKYNDDRQVKAADLAGKVIVLYLVPIHHTLSSFSRRTLSVLIDTYNYLVPDNNFEVVLVAHGIAEDRILSDTHTNSKNNFEDIFSCMPWTAIPFSEVTSRERLASRFHNDWTCSYSTPVVIDSSGMVLQSDGRELIEKYRGLAYPFSDEWIHYLEIQDAATAKNPSLKALLGSPKRDYVISNKGDKVLIDTLEKKVVALYFYEEGITPKWVTTNLNKAYEEFAQNQSCFEVVLIYLYGTNKTLDRTSEESFSNTFQTMPWLAIPYKDPKCERVACYFGYPNDHYSVEEEPTLVIFGPDGEFIEPWGADIMCKFKLPAYPFTRDKVAKLYTEKLQELKLDMLWDRNTIFRRKDNRQVQFSQLVGKRLILFFEGNDEFDSGREKVVMFLSMLKESYLDMKGTSNEFEVIYITSGKNESPYKKHIADVPWFFSLASELLPIDHSLYCCYCHLLLAPAFTTRSCSECGERPSESSMLAFDGDGRITRKTLELDYYDDDFPFCDISMEEEALYELTCSYMWRDMDKFHRGLRINSYDKNENLPYIHGTNILEHLHI